MGIDVYLRWDLQTDEQVDQQLCGFRTDRGNAGYLREAYHGEPYATRLLVPAAFDPDRAAPVSVSASTLRDRLPAAMSATIERERTLYNDPMPNEDTPAVKSMAEFVELATKLEDAGLAFTVEASW